MVHDERPARILVAEDDRGVRESLLLVLEVQGYDVEAVSNGEQALARIDEEEPALLILDVMMPNVDGLTVTRRLRARKVTLPILMLTARHEISDRVSGLEAGADDYLVKPFSVDELVARVRALLRRTSVSETDVAVSVGDLVLDPKRRTVTRAGRPIEVTKMEFDILELLMTNAGVVLDRDVVHDRIWGLDTETHSRSLDVFIGYLRRKTEADGGSRLIHTVRGIGYVARES